MTSSCLANLKEIGQAMQIYGQDNRGSIPYADMKAKGIYWSWDDYLNRRLGVNWDFPKLDAPFAKEQLEVLQCPADDLTMINKSMAREGAHRRSYAMPAHLVTASDWPPSSSCKTGVGIRLSLEGQNAPTNSGPRISYGLPNLTGNHKPLPAFKHFMIQQPAKTIAVTERLHPDNIIGNASESTIPNATEHIPHRLAINTAKYHKGLFNYLFLDGHVETLEPLKTLGAMNSTPAIQSGMWTVNPND